MNDGTMELELREGECGYYQVLSGEACTEVEVRCCIETRLGSKGIIVNTKNYDEITIHDRHYKLICKMSHFINTIRQLIFPFHVPCVHDHDKPPLD